jgi:hypothetical protein
MRLTSQPSPQPFNRLPAWCPLQGADRLAFIHPLSKTQNRKTGKNSPDQKSFMRPINDLQIPKPEFPEIFRRICRMAPRSAVNLKF